MDAVRILCRWNRVNVMLAFTEYYSLTKLCVCMHAPIFAISIYHMDNKIKHKIL